MSDLCDVRFRFFGGLGWFLPPSRRGRGFVHRVNGHPSVKDTIEALGVPHPEVAAILIDGRGADFRRQLRGGERVEVYGDRDRPRLRRTPRLRPRLPVRPCFVLDVHLGRLCRHLRLLGFDALYDPAAHDAALAAVAVRERRVLLSRDVGLLKRSEVRYGYVLRSTDAARQTREVLDRFDLHARARPFSRCLECNGRLRRAARRRVEASLPAGVREIRRVFRRCEGCGRIYWRGTHWTYLDRLIRGRLLRRPRGGGGR